MPSPYDRKLHKQFTLKASVSRLWNLWTTDEGARKFFSKNSRIGSKPGDPYEIYFSMDAPEGQRGSERCKILQCDPLRRFVFSWNAPPHLEQVRSQQTIVDLRFEAIDSESTTLSFTHSGWGEGQQWDEAFAYFENAWFAIVIPRLEKYLSGRDPWA